ncbi:hypothetical protein S7335_1837 [Synechococcus sp. PCC 7335]|uniref:hypothetical protein n=1 Tax=Synechococcus sp. (strain ATCC 29403 / PCC 7335) TaxID=91464 RepID=UPI00017EE058|nr:hypothetical protein [Synechococcus sp. PCC 7335]EDX84140.1 hypothetical protein S7335_1837 [Synechococcus sp. PCC 7335]
MTDPVLSQLVTVESDLAEQIEHLEAQLSQLQIKRQELLSVIDMFKDDEINGDRAASGSTRAKASNKDKASAKSEGRSSVASKSDRQPKQTSRSTKRKKDGRAAAWQKYVQSEYRSLALPEAVSTVLRSEPSKIFKIADVMSSIFKESMPKTSYLKARNRISNILSAGARDGTWYRGRNGRYSQSESVTKA